MGARAFVWCGGALFVLSLSSCAWLYLIVLGRHVPWAGPAAIAVDAALVTVFALHHSVFARGGIKRRLAHSIPAELLRSTYVWVASLLLILVSAAWQPIGGQFYRKTGLLAVALGAVQVIGLWLTARGAAYIDPLELAGIREAAATPAALQVTGPYGLVRHPLYLGWALMTFGAAHMTGDRLAFAVMTTGYLVVAIPWEEHSLRQSFGDAYERYMRLVKWRMIPFIY
jgi:protein-S-isoprenylcysteine O-methyltransferase Ste14